MSIDILCNTLIKIKNANLLNNKYVKVCSTSLILQTLNILKIENFISNYYSLNNNTEIVVNLRYEKNFPIIQSIQLISKPGLKKYIKIKKIKETNNNFGQNILTSSIGLLLDKQANIKNIGGELLFKIN
jgi:small subunit ribosomal protein S8